MHGAAMTYVAKQIHDHQLNQWNCTVLDLGGRNVNGTPRHLFTNAVRYISVDLVAGSGVDVVADCAELELDEVFDVVLSTELLEHTPRGAEIVAAAFRHLKPGGMFVATMAGPGRKEHSAHGDVDLQPGEFYCNVTPDMLNDWLERAGFVNFHIDTYETDLRCWATRNREVTE